MKKTLALALCTMIFFITNAQTVDDANEGLFNGMWWNFTNSPSIASMATNYGSELRGTMIAFRWSDLEPTHVTLIGITVNSKHG